MKTKSFIFTVLAAALMCSCGANPPESSTQPVLKPVLIPDKIDIVVGDSIKMSSENCTITRWEIVDNFIAATDDDANDGIIYGVHVGKTEVIAYYNENDTVEASLKAEINIKGSFDLYNDPNTDFSLTADKLQEAIGAATQNLQEDAYRTLVYGNIEKDKYIVCYDYFNDLLIEIRVCFPNLTSEDELDELYDFLLERYEQIAEFSFINAYDSEDADLNITLKTDKVFSKPVVVVSYTSTL
ncbi:MAG: hypothetical protein IJ776_08065 [Paludibacteraceae bacterium]|nr:hypothetical protein [Paludibacteraceae bacterium]